MPRRRPVLVQPTGPYIPEVGDWVWVNDPDIKHPWAGQVSREVGRGQNRWSVRIPGSGAVKVCPAEWLSDHPRNRWAVAR